MRQIAKLPAQRTGFKQQAWCQKPESCSSSAVSVNRLTS